MCSGELRQRVGICLQIEVQAAGNIDHMSDEATLPSLSPSFSQLKEGVTCSNLNNAPQPHCLLACVYSQFNRAVQR